MLDAEFRAPPKSNPASADIGGTSYNVARRLRLLLVPRRRQEEDLCAISIILNTTGKFTKPEGW
jgi:hypothetical protein